MVTLRRRVTRRRVSGKVWVCLLVAGWISLSATGQAQDFTQFYQAWINGQVALPPQTPQLLTPAIGASVTTPTATLTWSTLGAASYDVNFGTANPPPLALAVSGTATSWTSPTLLPNTTYFWSIVARNPFAFSTSVVRSFTTPPPIVVGLPAPWLTTDIGAPGLAGSATATSVMFSVIGAGVDIWDVADQFRYVYQPLMGDGQIVANVSSVQAIDPWTKAGLMIREGLLANAPNAVVEVTPGNGLVLQARASRGGTTTSVKVAGVAPRWLRLIRAGNTITASQSADGIAWTTIGGPRTITLTSQAYVGLAVTSHNPAALATAMFTDVLVTPAVPPQLTGRLDLQWDPVTLDTQGQPVTVTAYEAACGTAPPLYPFVVNAGLSTQVSVAGLTLGTSFRCVARAYAGAAVSANSNEVSGLPK